MSKNLNYEPNVLEAFVESCRKYGGPNFSLGPRRCPTEDGILINDDTGQVFSAELTEVAKEDIKARTAYLIKKTGVGEAYESYKAEQVIQAIKKKEQKYLDIKDKILILDAFSCIPFRWNDYWKPVIDYGQKTKFAAIYAVNIDSSQIIHLKIK